MRQCKHRESVHSIVFYHSSKGSGLGSEQTWGEGGAPPGQVASFSLRHVFHREKQALTPTFTPPDKFKVAKYPDVYVFGAEAGHSKKKLEPVNLLLRGNSATHCTI